MADGWIGPPRVGQIVVLKDGRRGEVATVLRGADALRTKREVEMLLLTASMRAEMGAGWANLYYEATVLIEDTAPIIVTVTPNKVAAVEDPS